MPKENRFLRQYCANIEQVGYRRALAERGVGPPIKYLRHETEAADISVLSREERSTLHARGYSEGQQRANVIETARQLGAPIPPATFPPIEERRYTPQQRQNALQRRREGPLPSRPPPSWAAQQGPPTAPAAPQGARSTAWQRAPSPAPQSSQLAPPSEQTRPTLPPPSEKARPKPPAVSAANPQPLYEPVAEPGPRGVLKADEPRTLTREDEERAPGPYISTIPLPGYRIVGRGRGYLRPGEEPPPNPQPFLWKRREVLSAETPQPEPTKLPPEPREGAQGSAIASSSKQSVAEKIEASARNYQLVTPAELEEEVGETRRRQEGTKRVVFFKRGAGRGQASARTVRRIVRFQSVTPCYATPGGYHLSQLEEREEVIEIEGRHWDEEGNEV